MTVTLDALRQQIYKDWDLKNACYCNEILQQLIFGNWNLNDISCKELIDIKPRYCGDRNIESMLKIVPYLVGDRVHLLELKMYFFDYETETRHELTDDQMRAINKGEICHLVTNELIDYVLDSENVFMYFVASNVLRLLKEKV